MFTKKGHGICVEFTHLQTPGVTRLLNDREGIIRTMTIHGSGNRKRSTKAQHSFAFYFLKSEGIHGSSPNLGSIRTRKSVSADCERLGGANTLIGCRQYSVAPQLHLTPYEAPAYLLRAAAPTSLFHETLDLSSRRHCRRHTSINTRNTPRLTAAVPGPPQVTDSCVMINVSCEHNAPSGAHP